MAEITLRILENFKKAITALDNALALQELPELANRDAALLRFELAAELMPKVIKRILAERGAAPVLPKDIVRAALSAEVISESLASLLLDPKNCLIALKKNTAPLFKNFLNV